MISLINAIVLFGIFMTLNIKELWQGVGPEWLFGSDAHNWKIAVAQSVLLQVGSVWTHPLKVI